MTTALKGQGRAYRWIMEHLNYPHQDWCLIWPFTRNSVEGYGTLGYLGQNYYSHRFMCEMVHGKPPTPKHKAAHSCGKGHEGCVNPHHLSWKTQSENLAECRLHGTAARQFDGKVGRLTDKQVESIKGLRGVKTRVEIADLFNISRATVSDIWLGRTHSIPHKTKLYSPEEDEKIREAVRRGMTIPQMAEFVGRPKVGVAARMYRLGLKSGSGYNAKIMP